ncbi:hypothetical protein [Rhizobium leguminosarum]|uniref:Uncharacterized protein n=1 Tax=Rhizobium leguminosarum TaxID=384 RepID=A0A7M3DR48_RHILE|nr:hypothetical protein [Rhizobium leguminosarum]TAY51100.1 hypothetical protein ELH90_04985 [Rhizobium leguminosarum]
MPSREKHKPQVDKLHEATRQANTDDDERRFGEQLGKIAKSSPPKNLSLRGRMRHEALRDAIFEIRWHAEIAANSFERLDLLNGYDQAKMRITQILSALDRADDALDVLVTPEEWDQTWVNSKGLLREAYSRKD